MRWRSLIILMIHFLVSEANDGVELIAPNVEHVIATERRQPGVCSEACYKVATCNEELGGRCDCPKHLAGPDCVRNATASRLSAFAQVPRLEARYPMSCINGCNGRGHCVMGACVCSRGNFSSDCSLSMGPDGRPALLAGSGYKPRERRPRIYVYDIPHKYSSWFHPAKVDRSLHWVFWERLLGSGAMVADGEEADWYWLPIKLRSNSDGYRLLEALQYVRKMWPWYDRLQGHRHLIIHTGDTGRGEVPGDVQAATANMSWLHHWGLTHDCNASGWKAAHRPGKDIVIPVYRDSRQGVGLLPMSGLHPRAPRMPRTRTLLFAGRICGDYSKPDPTKPWPQCATNKSPGYSQGVRQLVHYHHHNRTGYKISTSNGRYPLDLLSFKWCLAPSGGGHGHRQVLASVMGCLPLIISDQVLQPFEPEMDWNTFGLRLPEAAIPSLHTSLEQIGEEQLEARRDVLRCAAQHLVYSSVGGAHMQEDGRWDAFEFILEILRMQQTYPGLHPADYAATDDRFRSFLHCGNPDGMQAYGRKLRAAQEKRYPTQLPLPPPLPPPPSGGGAAAAAAAAAPPPLSPGAYVSWSNWTMEQFNDLLVRWAVAKDRTLAAAPLALCSASVWDERRVRCSAMKTSALRLVPGGAACEGHSNLVECPRPWP